MPQINLNFFLIVCCLIFHFIEVSFKDIFFKNYGSFYFSVLRKFAYLNIIRFPLIFFFGDFCSFNFYIQVIIHVFFFFLVLLMWGNRQVWTHFFPHHIFPIEFSFPLCWRSTDYIFIGLFLNSLFCSINLYFCPYFNTANEIISFIVSLEIMLWKSFNVFLLIANCLCSFSSFPHPNDFRYSMSMFTEESTRILRCIYRI